MRSGSRLDRLGSLSTYPYAAKPPGGGVALEAPKKGGGPLPHSQNFSKNFSSRLRQYPIPKFFLKSLAKGDNNLYRMEFLAHSNWIHLLLA